MNLLSLLVIYVSRHLQTSPLIYLQNIPYCVGHYVFLETSRPIGPGWKARLVSKYIGTRVACLKFWYHAYGGDAHMGELQLVVKTHLVGTISSQRFNAKF